MKILRWTLPLIVSLIAVQAWADDDDAKQFPNRMETTPNTPSKVQVVGNPSQPTSTGALGPGAGSQMGAGIQIPLGGNPDRVKPDADVEQTQEKDQKPDQK